MSLGMIVGLFVFAIVCFIIAGILGAIESSNRKKQEEAEKTRLISIIENAIIESGLEIDSWENIKNECINNSLDYTKRVAHRINRLIQFTLKYENVLSEDELSKLIDGEYFVGMTEQMLIESIGQPNKIEDEVMKTKTKRTYIYGNKNSGDVLVFEQGRLVRFKDR